MTHSTLDLESIDMWVRAVLRGENRGEDIRAQLRKEIPPLLSWIVRGGCAVQCQHCIFPEEGPKAYSPRIKSEVILSLLAQLSGRGHLVHEGRQLLQWQVPILAAAKRAGHSVSVINNGQYATPGMLALCEREGLRLDALDVSIDGPERIHNLQRNHVQAWRWAMNGLAEGRRIADKLTSLFTLTSMTADHVAETGLIAGDLVDEWHISPLTVRPGIEHMAPSSAQMAEALNQLAGLRLGNTKIYLRSYSLSGFMALCEVIGGETVRQALQKAEVVDNGIVLDVGGFTLYFYPKSLQCNETLVVDADAVWRLPFSVAHRLDELQRGVSAEGDDLAHFSICPVSEKLDVAETYARSVETWWQAVGSTSFNEERVAVGRLLG
jgi:hypothetical protein